MTQQTSTLNQFEQGLLKYLSEEQLKKIQSVRIGIGGAGGLGSNCAMMLVRTGFKHIRLIDQDVIDESNLNRQQYFLDEVGMDKVMVMRKRLLAVNPELDISAYKVKWTPETGQEHFNDCRFIIEAFDHADWKYKFAEFYSDRAEAVISGVGMAGLLEKKPIEVKRIGNIYIVGDRCTDSALGHPPMAPRVTMCAAKMAEIVLDLTLDVPINF